METDKKEELVRAFHMMWDNYPEVVRLIDRRFNIIAGNPAFFPRSEGKGSDLVLRSFG